MAKTTPVRLVPVSRAMIDDASGMVRMLVETLSNAKFIFATLSAPTEWDATDAKWMVRRCCVRSESLRYRIGFVSAGEWSNSAHGYPGYVSRPAPCTKMTRPTGVPFDELGASLIYFTLGLPRLAGPR
jgi:hypothetical protein